MNRTERYLTQATRGLIGRRKLDAEMELRSAIEDKVWRHLLAGLQPADAETVAFRDLGSPHVVARDFHQVHTARSALRVTLLMGVAGVLSLQAVTQEDEKKASEAGHTPAYERKTDGA